MCLEYLGKISGKNNDPLKIYSQNKKVTMVYPAHVSFDFVTSLAFFIHFELNTLSALSAIYSTCTIDNRIFNSYCALYFTCFPSISKTHTNSNFKLLQNHLIIRQMHAVRALRICVTSDAHYFCFFFHLRYATLSSESQGGYFYTTDLFIECSRFVYI